MSRKNKKYLQQEEEMIEMRDFNAHDVAPEEVLVEELWICDPKPTQKKPLKSSPNFDSTNMPLLQNKSSYKQPQPQSHFPPSNLYHQPQPGVIRMNGMAFQVPSTSNPSPKPIQTGHRGPPPPTPPTHSPKLPQMKVHCKWCTLQQLVSGNSHIFVCCVCNNMNECQPVYNLFTCYGCRAQVCYQLGVSDVIRCTKCKTINKVPMSVKPNYQPARDIQDRRVVPEPIRAEELSGVRPMLAFRKQEREEEIILLDEEGEREREVPAKKKFVQTYPDFFDSEQEKSQYSYGKDAASRGNQL